jgi:hypothetical protein
VFDLLGVLLAMYTLYAVGRGQVYAKSGPGGRSVLRSQSPRYFWTVIAIYAGLSIALLTIF